MHPSALLIVLPVLFGEALQVPDSTYATPGLREAVERAALAHSHPPDALASFSSTLESEITLLLRDADGNERPTQVEQVAGRMAWLSDGRLRQEVTGYRSLFAGVTVSVLSYLKAPWVVGPLYGDRVPILFAPDSVGSSGETRAVLERGTGPPSEASQENRAEGTGIMVHPFATDRADYYRFSGGDTVMVLSLPERDVPLMRVEVHALEPAGEALLFHGEILLDATRHEIVRMRGWLSGRPSRPSLFVRLIGSTMEVVPFLELENAEWEGSFWLPHRQRLEVAVAPVFAEDRVLLRIITGFEEMTVNVPEVSARWEEGPTTRMRQLQVQPAETLRNFRDWRTELGAVSGEASLGDFDGVAPRSWMSAGPPRFRVGASSLPEILRYDRVEGLFTGLGGRLDFRDAAPGTFAEIAGGYAWAESALRGRVTGGIRKKDWGVEMSAERRLTSTNDFPRAFGAYPNILGIFGVDDFDYVDRFTAGIGVTLERALGGVISLRAGMSGDRAVRQHVQRDGYRELRPVREGDYARLLFTAAWGGRAGGEFFAPGVSARLSWEMARGDLAWDRLEGVVRARHQRSRWRLAGEIHGGVLHSRLPPPQTLFELGSLAGRLPGFEYKAFTGDRAALSAIQVMYVLPILEAPLRIGPAFLPGLSPSPALELSAGWTGASSRAIPVLERYGWTDSAGVRATLFGGVRFFGGALGLGMAKPLGEAGPWRFELGLAPGS